MKLNIPPLYLVFGFMGSLFIGLILLLYYVRMKTRMQILEIQQSKGRGRPKGPKRYFGTYGGTATMLTFIIASIIALFESHVLVKFFASFVVTTFAIAIFYLYLNKKEVKTSPVEELGVLILGLGVFYIIYKLPLPLSIAPLSLTDLFQPSLTPPFIFLAILLLLLVVVVANHFTGFLTKRT